MSNDQRPKLTDAYGKSTRYANRRGSGWRFRVAPSLKNKKLTNSPLIAKTRWPEIIKHHFCGQQVLLFVKENIPITIFRANFGDPNILLIQLTRTDLRNWRQHVKSWLESELPNQDPREIYIIPTRYDGPLSPSLHVTDVSNTDGILKNGTGLGETVSVEQGRQTIHELALELPLEEWAGPLAGSMEIERTRGIRRQTLNHWRSTGDVIAFLKGVSKHVYPLSQFIDGRPVKGLRDIIAFAGSQRAAWLWLNEENPTLGGKTGIDLLRGDQIEVVKQAAEDYFLGL